MSSPKVSVVIPSYGRPEKLKRAVKSVESQTHRPIELIVVDDCSPAPVANMIDEMSLDTIDEVTVIRHETNRGASSARNTGIDAATGEYIAFLDDDDEWKPEKLRRQVESIEAADDEVSVVYTGVRNVDAEGTIISTKTATLEGKITKALLCQNHTGTFSSVLVEASAARAVDGLDERFPYWDDWEFFIRLSQKRTFEAVPEPLVIRHNSGEQLTDDFETNRDVAFPLFIEKFRPIAAEYGPFFERKMMGHLHYRLGYRALSTGYYDEARLNLLRAVRWYPFSTSFYAYLFAVLGGARTYKPTQRLRRWVARRLDSG